MNEQDDYLWDRSGPEDPDVARLEQLLRPLAHDRPLDELRLRRPARARRWPWIAGALVAAAAVITLVVVRGRGAVGCTGTTGFAFTTQGGPVACGGAQLASGVLPVGGVLDTGDHRAVLAIADIGRAELGEGTRIRLERSSARRHELFLERGRMHARVTAPPRLFAVTTPSTQVVDLGCEYTIAIDAAGAGSISVQSGKVELETRTGLLVVAPQGTHARLLPGRTPSVPISDGASPAVIAAVEAFERDGAPALDRLLAAATARDAITVANLYALVPVERRKAVLERLSEFVVPPAGLTIDQASASPARFEPWRDAVIVARDGGPGPKSPGKHPPTP